MSVEKLNGPSRKFDIIAAGEGVLGGTDCAAW